MSDQNSFDLPGLFRQVRQALADQRGALNQMDEANHNHGDHMVEIFDLAVRAAEGRQEASLAEAIEHAAQLLEGLQDNASAEVYRRGLSHLALQFRQRGIGLGALLPYVQGVSREKRQEENQAEVASSANVLKGLLAALAAWENDAEAGASGQPELDLGYLMGMGMAFLQAKQKGGDRLDVLAETAVSATPLSRVPHRHHSGVLVLRTLLGALSGAG